MASAERLEFSHRTQAAAVRARGAHSRDPPDASRVLRLEIRAAAASATGCSANPAAGTTQFRALWIDDGTPAASSTRRRRPTSTSTVHSELRDPMPTARRRWSAKAAAAGRATAFTHRRARRIAAGTARHATRPYRIDVHASAGATQRACARHAARPVAAARLRPASWRCPGQNLADLYPLLGIATPDYAAVSSSTAGSPATSRHETRTLALRQFHRRRRRQRPGRRCQRRNRARAPVSCAPNLVSKRLDFDDLAGFVGKRRRRPAAARSRQPRSRSAGRARGGAARACCPTRPTNSTSCARWMPTCAGRRTASTRRSCRSTTWTRTCCWRAACCDWSR